MLGSISESERPVYRLSTETRDRLVNYIESKQKEVIAILFREDVTKINLQKLPPSIENFLEVYPKNVQIISPNTPSGSTLDKVELVRALAFAISAKLLPVIGFVGVLTAYSSGAIAHHIYKRSKAAKIESLKKCAAPAEELIFEPTDKCHRYKDVLGRPLQFAEVTVVEEACRAYKIGLEILEQDQSGRINLHIEELFRNYLIVGELDTNKKMKGNAKRFFHDGYPIERYNYDKIIKLITRIQASLIVNHEELIESIDLLAPRDPRPKKTLNLEPGNFPDEFTHCKSILKGHPRPGNVQVLPPLKHSDVKEIVRFPDYCYVSEKTWVLLEMENYAEVSETELVNRDTAEIHSKKKIRSERQKKCLNKREEYFSRQESECRKLIRAILTSAFFKLSDKCQFRAINRHIVRPIKIAMFPKRPLFLKKTVKNQHFSFQDRLKEDALEITLRKNKERIILSHAARNEFVYLDSEPEDKLSDDYISQSLKAYFNQLLCDCLKAIEVEAKGWKGNKPFSSIEGEKIVYEDRKTVWGRFVKNSRPSQIPQSLSNTFLEISEQKIPGETARYALVLGCGKSQSAIALLEKGWHVVCIDYSNEVIEEMRSYVNQELNPCWTINGKLKLVCAKIEDYQPAEKFDLVLANSCLSYCNPREIGTILKNVYQSLNPGCHFLGDFLTRELIIDKKTKKMIVDKGSVDRERDRGAWFLEDRRDLLVLLASQGFQVTRCLKGELEKPTVDPLKQMEKKPTDDPKSYFFTAFKRRALTFDLMEESGITEELVVLPENPSLAKLFKNESDYSLQKRRNDDEIQETLRKLTQEVTFLQKTPNELLSLDSEEPEDKLSDAYISWSLRAYLNQSLSDCFKFIEAEAELLKRRELERGELQSIEDSREAWGMIPQSLSKTFLEICEQKIPEKNAKYALVLGCRISQSVITLLEKGWHVVCVDFSDKVIGEMATHIAEQQNLAIDKLKLVCEKIEDYIPDDKFDLVLANACLSYCNPRTIGTILNNVHQSLNPDCHFLGDFLSRELIIDKKTKKLIVNKKSIERERDRGAWFLEDQRNIQVLLASHGFKVARCSTAEESSKDDLKSYFFTALKA